MIHAFKLYCRKTLQVYACVILVQFSFICKFLGYSCICTLTICFFSKTVYFYLLSILSAWGLSSYWFVRTLCVDWGWLPVACHLGRTIFFTRFLFAFRFGVWWLLLLTLNGFLLLNQSLCSSWLFLECVAEKVFFTPIFTSFLLIL